MFGERLAIVSVLLVVVGMLFPLGVLLVGICRSVDYLPQYSGSEHRRNRVTHLLILTRLGALPRVIGRERLQYRCFGDGDAPAGNQGVTGKRVSDAWMDGLQRGGIAVLLLMMSIAMFNDITRLFG